MKECVVRAPRLHWQTRRVGDTLLLGREVCGERAVRLAGDGSPYLLSRARRDPDVSGLAVGLHLVAGFGAEGNVGEPRELAVDAGDAFDLTFGGEAFVEAFVAEIAGLLGPWGEF